MYLSPLQEASLEMFQRCLSKLSQAIDSGLAEGQGGPTSLLHLRAMCREAIGSPDMLVDKQSRWLGYVQGIMTVHGLLDVEEEREFSRPIFHQAYRAMGIDIPSPVTVAV